MNTSSKKELVVARLTPVGRSAVSCVGVYGSAASELVRNVWRRVDGALSDNWREWSVEEAQRPIFGRFHYAGLDAPGEEVVANWRSRNAIELDCHGGDFVTTKILDYFIRGGARKITGDAWNRLVNHEEREEVDREVAPYSPEFQTLFLDACDELIANASTEETAKIACDQRESACDFANKIASLLREAARGLPDANASLEDALARVLSRRTWGRKLFEPFVVSFLGVANSGKSSLFNALLGRDRAVVSDYEGTTRDLLDSAFLINGWRFCLVDSAGLRQTDDKVEREGIELAREVARRADLILRIYDGTRDYRDQDVVIQALAPNESASTFLNVWNKIDLARVANRPTDVEFVSTSAKTGAGIDALMDAIFCRTVGRLDRAQTKSGREDLILWTDEQVHFVEKLADDCRSGRHKEALATLTSRS